MNQCQSWQIAPDSGALDRKNLTRVALAQIPESAIREVRLSSGVCTPNGDGVNEAIDITYQLVNLTGAVPVQVGVYALSGRKVNDLPRAASRSALGRVGE